MRNLTGVLSHLALPAFLVIALARLQTFVEARGIKALVSRLFLEQRPRFVDAYILSDKKPVEIERIATLEALNHAAQLSAAISSSVYVFTAGGGSVWSGYRTIIGVI